MHKLYGVVISLLPSASHPPSSSEEGKNYFTYRGLQKYIFEFNTVHCSAERHRAILHKFRRNLFHFCKAKISLVRRTDFIFYANGIKPRITTSQSVWALLRIFVGKGLGPSAVFRQEQAPALHSG